MAHLVLIVEDEAKIRELVRRYLERAGLRVLTTGSGAEAITMAADAHPDRQLVPMRAGWLRAGPSEHRLRFGRWSVARRGTAAPRAETGAVAAPAVR